MKKDLNLNITNGSRTIWVTADGRHIPVKDLTSPHLLNILTDLYEKAEKAVLGHSLNRYYYLAEYCPTFLTLEVEARYRRLNVSNVGKPIISEIPKNETKKRMTIKIDDKEFYLTPKE